MRPAGPTVVGLARADEPAASEAPMHWRLIVMAKAPAAGLAKTRLIPALGADCAAALAARLLAHTIEQAEAAAPAAIELCVAPAPGHPAFAEWAARPGWQWSAQGEGDLGARMERALTRALAAAPAALLIGSDAPELTAARLREAAAALREHDAVFVPALDGGYALVGLRRTAPVLFEGVAWSTPAVMAQTRARAASARLRWAELAPVADIDEPADLARLPAGWDRR